MKNPFSPRPLLTLLPVLALSASLLASNQDAGTAPLRVFLRAGPKTHGPGEHDHPRFLADWTRLLRERGAEVHGALSFPSPAELANTDVLVLYAAEGGSIHGAERQALDDYLARGGAIVALHDAVCGDDPHWFKTVVGGAWEHGHSKWHEGKIGLYFAGAEHPITNGVANFDLDDEIYWDLHLAEGAHVLATSFHTPFDVTPQMWTYEKDAYRAFVSIQGHETATFDHSTWRALVLRGIAWAGRRDVDALTTAAERAGLAYPPGGPTAPTAAADELELHPDFEASLVAAEPLVVNPISIEWDARGRTWVALTPGYPYKEASSGVPAHDEIAILEDTDGDGRMDRKQVFHASLDLVTSLVLHGDGAIVSAAPDILWLRDTDGDDVADVVETLYTGFGYGDTHAVVSNLRWGLDGWIYATQGYSGGASRNIVGKEEFGSIPNGLFRFRPDGSAIEMVSSYGSNTWGLDFSENDELFFTMANGSHLRHVVMPEKDLARARVGAAQSWKDIVDHRQANAISEHDRSVYRQIDFVGGFTAASGCLVYGGGVWPDEFAGNHFVCEPTLQIVHRDRIEPAGPSFRASRVEEQEFIASRDLWFCPVHLRTGPDGALYVCDFYNQAVVHNDTRGPEHGPTNAAVRPDRDRGHGRIWRVQHKAARPAVALASDIARQSTPDLVRMLEQTGEWPRRIAHRLLSERRDPDAVPLLVTAATTAAQPFTRIHALWLLELLQADPVKRIPTLVRALDDPDPAVQRCAARIAAAYSQTDWFELVGFPLVHLLQSSDERTRLAAMSSLALYDPSVLEGNALAERYAGLNDDWERSALVAALMSDPRGAMRAALRASSGDLAAELAEEISRLGDPGALAGCLTVLARQTDAPAPLLVRVLTVLREKLRPGVLPTPSDPLDRALETLLAHPELEVAVASLPWAADGDRPALAQHVSALGERVVHVVEDPQAPARERLGALRILLDLPARRAVAYEAAADLLAPYYSLEVHLEAIAALRGVADDGPGDVLAAAFASLSHKGREAAFDALVTRATWMPALLARIEDRDVRPADLGPLRLHRLRQYPDEKVAARARELLATADTRGASSIDELVAKLLPEVRKPGDPVRGRELFATNCGNCHTLGGEGGNVGPELTGIGAHGIETLLPVILDPNREVDPAYLDYVVETVEGTLVTGVVARETGDAIVLRSTSGEVEVLRDDIETMRSTGLSPMPAGFEELGADALRDLLSYVTQGYEGFRVLDLAAVANASTSSGMYDPGRDPNGYRFARYGVLEVAGVPFDVPDPELAPAGHNVLVLKGGLVKDWRSKSLVQRVEIPVGMTVARVHVLGGVAGWGHPFGNIRDEPAVRWTWVYEDGQEESVVLNDGVEFADWIGRYDVPGSEFVPDLLRGGPGQIRRFALAPGRAQPIARLRLESFDNHLAPTFLALTAERPGHQRGEPRSEPAAARRPVSRLIMGGGSSHDYPRWFDREDRQTLAAAYPRDLAYTDRPQELAERLPELKVLALTNNQPLEGEALRAGIFDHLEHGRGIYLIHAATWRNWSDWPEYNARIAGGGAASHEAYGRFRVQVAKPEHPVMRGVPTGFEIDDELYRFEPEEGDAGALIEVLAYGISPATGDRYPVVWTVAHPRGRILCNTLGHDGAAHQHEAYKALLTNGFKWLEGE